MSKMQRTHSRIENSMDEMQNMRAFVNVVETGSFASAARVMNLSPSVITKRINQLEDFLDAELLRRSTRQLTVTDMGSAYYERCARILAEVEEARSSVKSMNTGLTGMIRISCTSSFAASFGADDVCEFQIQHPDLRIDFRANDYIYDPIAEGYDLCIQPRDILNDSITKRPLVQLHRMLIASPAYASKYGLPKVPEELAKHRAAINDFISPDHVLHLSKGEQVHEIKVKPVMLTNSISLLDSAVASGECIALVPIFYFADQLAAGTVVPVLNDYVSPQAELSAYYRRSPHVPMKIRAFVNFLLDKYASEPPWQKRILEQSPELAHHLTWCDRPRL